MSDEKEAVRLEVSADEMKIVMAYRYREELAALEATCIRNVSLCAGREKLTPEQVRALCNAATAYDVLLTKCGYLEELEPDEEESEE